MNMPALKRRPFPVADRNRNGDLNEAMHPRLAAIRLLREKIADRKAGLDPWDRGVFILVALEHEKVWANRALSLVGFVLPTSTDTPHGGRRFRAAVQDDVRAELGLDRAHPPLMDDEPLASRGVGAPSEGEMIGAILDVLHPVQTLHLVTDDEPVGEPVPIMRAALDRAARLASLRVDCGCGAPAGTECPCTVGDRLASAARNGNEVH